VEPDSVVVEVVEDGQAALVALAVVWLGATGPSSIGPVDIVVTPPTWPADTSATHISSRPKVLLTLPTNQSKELPLFVAAVNGNRSHAILPAEIRPSARCEGGATKTPRHQVVSSSKVVVWSVATPTPAPCAIALRTTTSISATSEKVPEKSKLGFSDSESESGGENDDRLHFFLQLLYQLLKKEE